MNKNKVILDLCGGTGAWSKPYEEAGYTVHNITLPDYNILFHVKTDDIICFYHPSAGYSLINIKKKNIYGILAAPPCTMFSLARTNAKTPRDFKQGMDCVKACLGIIWECRYKNNLKFWCIENPIGYLRQFIGKPAFTFQPFEFGDNSKKRTDLWGYFNIPEKNPIPKPDYPSKGKGSWASQYPNPGQKERSITPTKFAEAFFKANQ